MKTYHGSCHCGEVRFESDLDLTETAIRKCNCGFCLKSGYKKALIGYDAMRITAGEDRLQNYHAENSPWPDGDIDHYHCPRCGVQPFSRGYLEGQMGGNLGRQHRLPRRRERGRACRSAGDLRGRRTRPAEPRAGSHRVFVGPTVGLRLTDTTSPCRPLTLPLSRPRGGRRRRSHPAAARRAGVPDGVRDPRLRSPRGTSVLRCSVR